MSIVFARLKPYDGKRHVRRSYTVFGIKFVENRGWYKVDEPVAAYLATVRQVDSDPDSNPAFDLCSEAEAKAIDNKERLKAIRRPVEEAEKARPARGVHNVRRADAAQAAKRALSSGDLTTKDLAHKREEEPAEAPADMAPDLSGDFDDDMAGDPPAPAVDLSEAGDDEEELAPAAEKPAPKPTKTTAAEFMAQRRAAKEAAKAAAKETKKPAELLE